MAAIPALRVVTSCANLSEFVRVFRARAGTDTLELPGRGTLEVPGAPAPPPLDTVGRLVVTLANRVTILDGDAALVAAPGGALTIRFTRLDVRSRGLLLHLQEVRDAATLGPVPRHLVPLGAPVGDPAACRDDAGLAACAIEPLSARPADPAKRAMPVLPTLRGRPSTAPPPTGAPSGMPVVPSTVPPLPRVGASADLTGTPPTAAPPTAASPTAALPTPAPAKAPYVPKPTVATRLPPPPMIPTVRTPVMARPATATVPAPPPASMAPPPTSEPEAPASAPASSSGPVPAPASSSGPVPAAASSSGPVPTPIPSSGPVPTPIVDPAPPPVEAERLPRPPVAAPPPRVTATLTTPPAPVTATVTVPSVPAAPVLAGGPPTPRPGEKARRRREEQATLIGVRAPKVIEADTDPQRPAAPARPPIVEHEYTLHGPAPVRTGGPGVGDFTAPDIARGIPDDGISGGLTLRGIAVPTELDTGETEANHGHDDLATDVAFALPDDPGDELDPLVDPPAPSHQAPRGIALAVSKASATPRPVLRVDSGPSPAADVAVTAPMSTAPQHDPFDERPVVAPPPRGVPAPSAPSVLPSGTAPAPIPPGAWATPSWSPVPGGASPSPSAPPPPATSPTSTPPNSVPPVIVAAPISEPVPSLQISPPLVEVQVQAPAPVPVAMPPMPTPVPPPSSPAPAHAGMGMHGTTPLPMMAPAYAAQAYPPPIAPAPPILPPAAPPYVPPPAQPIYPTAQMRALDYPPPPSGASQSWRRRVEVSDEGTDMTEIISVPRPVRRRRWPVIVITTAVIVVIAVVGLIVASSSSDDDSAAPPAPAPTKPPVGSSAAPAPAAAPPVAPAATTPATDEALPPEGAAEPAPEAAAALPAPPPADATCRVEFTSSPSGAAVVVAGAPLGTTPLTIDVACSAAAVAFKRERYQTRTLALSLAPGPTPTAVHARLERPSWNVTLTSRPAGAKITVAGRAAGTTPAKIQVPAYDGALVELSLPGYRPERQRVAPTRNNQKVELRLRRK